MVGLTGGTQGENVLSLGWMDIMETVLKHHNQIELPQDLCRKMELLPGMRFEVEVDSAEGTIILVPITEEWMRIYRQHMQPSETLQK
jgi:hypothetical protein